jgi:hypothetical protein
MTWLQIAFSTLLATTLVVAWSRYSLEKGRLRRLAELCLCQCTGGAVSGHRGRTGAAGCV